MSYDNVLKKIKDDFNGALEYFRQEIAKIRTNRASPSIIEDIQADCYGSKIAIKQLAAIHTPSAREIVIQPWDKNSLEPIARAITQSNLGLNPVVDGVAIRLLLPQLTEERRKEYLKLLKEKMEEARVKIRRHRDEAWGEIQELCKDGKIREDDKFRGKDELQKLVDEYNNKIEEMGAKKEEEIMTV